MKNIIIILFTLTFSFSAFAETTTQIIYKIKSVHSIDTADGTFTHTEADIVTKRSDGLQDEGQCLVNREKGILSGRCTHKDTDGDIRYSKFFRDTIS